MLNTWISRRTPALLLHGWTLLGLWAIVPACGTTRAAQESADKWAPLFNGTDLSGWRNVNCSPTTWAARDGMIVCSGKPTGVLRTEKMYENFVLELEYRHLEKGGNAGLFIWSDALTAKGQPFTRSIEVQVMDGVETPNYTSDGDIFSIHGARMKPDRPHPAGWERCLPSEKRAKPSPQWNHYRVTCLDGTIKLAVNGKEVSGGAEIAPRKGYICLEAEGSEVHFRNLKIQELPAAVPAIPASQVADTDLGFRALFDGTLASFKEDAGKEGHWTPRDWVLAYDGKGGDLWTRDEFADFELIADWRWAGKSQGRMKRPVIAPDGSVAKNPDGSNKEEEVEEYDSGIFLRGNSKSQVNMWNWSVGSGEVYGYRTDGSMPPAVRAAVTPKERADAPVGQWNRFKIRMKGETLNVWLNGKHVIVDAALPGVAARGPIGLQHHGSALEFANLYIRQL